jgi:hypothetical protein
MIYDWYNQDGPNHFNTQFRNQTKFWSSTDSEPAFNKHIADPEAKKQLTEIGWNSRTAITYTYNNHGFRAEAFDNRSCGLALGCSFTEGVGLPVEHTWPSVLSKLTSLHFWNLGVSGQSGDTVFRLLDYYLPKFNPKAVCVLMPASTRFEYCNMHGKYDGNLAHNLDIAHSLFFKEWFSQDENSMIKARKNLLAIERLCDVAGVPLIVKNSSEITTYFYQYDSARDLSHPGTISNRMIAEEMCAQMKSR